MNFSMAQVHLTGKKKQVVEKKKQQLSEMEPNTPHRCQKVTQLSDLL